MFSYKVPDRAILLEIKQYHLNTAWNIVCVCVCVYIYIYICTKFNFKYFM